MAYVIEAWVKTERDEGFLPDGKIPVTKKTKPSLYAAVQEADRIFGKMKDPASVVEVSEQFRDKKGPAKYRIERNSAGAVQKIPLV